MNKIFYLCVVLIQISCIGFDIVDDRVEPVVVVLNPIDSLKIGETYQLNAKYLNESGIEEPAIVQWRSSNNLIITISSEGLIEALSLGRATIIANHNFAADTLIINTGEVTTIAEQSRSTELITVSSYPLTGTVDLLIKDGNNVLQFRDNFNTTSALPGLYVYLSNNKNTTAGAYEVGAVNNFTGDQEYLINSNIGINDYNTVLFFCKPFNVAVGYGELMP